MSAAEGHIMLRVTTEPLSRPAERPDLLAEARQRIVAVARERGLGLALDILRDPDDAEDALQDALEDALRALPGFRGQARVETWFYRILVNRSRRRLRRRALIAWLPLTREPAGDREGPEAAAIRARLGSHLGAALDELSPRQRTAVVLRHVEGLSTAEVASVMQTSESSVKQHLFRAVRKLRGRLRDEL